MAVVTMTINQAEGKKREASGSEISQNANVDLCSMLETT